MRTGSTRVLVAAGVTGWALAWLWLAPWTRGPVQLDVRDDVAPAAGVVDGLWPTEREGSRAFAWTGQRLRVTLDGLDRRTPWRVRVSVRTARPEGVPPPDVVLSIDGLAAGRWTVAGEQALEAELPPASRRGAVIDLDVDPVFVPGGQDRRALGVQLLAGSLDPSGRSRPPPAVVTATLVVALGAAVLLLAAGADLASVLAVAGLTAGAPVLLTKGLASFGGYPSWAAAWASGILAAGALAALALRRRTLVGWRPAIVLAAAVAVSHGWILGHPSMPLEDSLFHLHRFEMVEDGRYYFTSVGPGGEFPYPIALYVLADLVGGLVADKIWLLKAIAIVAHAGAGLAVFSLAARWTTPGRALWAEALFFAAPASFQTLGAAYLTNSFGQSMAVIAMGVAGAWSFDRRPWTGGALLAAATTVAFLSHVSTFLQLAAALGVLAAWSARRRPRARAGWLPAAALAVAAVVSVGVFYGHFIDTYRWPAGSAVVVAPAVGSPTPVMRAEAHQTAFVPGWSALIARLAAVPRYVALYLGWWLAGLALAGAVIARRRLHGQPAWALVAWLVSAAGFFVLGQVTPIDVRYYLWVAPVLALLASQVAPGARPASLADWLGGVAATVVVVRGVAYWLSWLGPA